MSSRTGTDHGGDTGTRLVGLDDLRACLAAAFGRLDRSPADAGELAGLLVDGELRGHPDHGVAALEILTRFYRDGTLQPRPRVRVVHDTDGALLLDGDRGCGPAAPMRAMRWCVADVPVVRAPPDGVPPPPP